VENDLDRKIEKKLEELLPTVLERYKIYSREDLLTREEFLEALKQINERFEAMHKQMDKRFEKVDKRFEKVDKRFEMIDKKFEALIEEMHHGFDKNYVVLTSFDARVGVRLEKTIVNLAKKALEQRLIDITQIEYNTEIIDDGTYFEEGANTHIDMYVYNSNHIFFEIKFQFDLHDLYDFLRRVKIAENFLKVKSDKNIIISLEISEDAQREAEKRGLDIITGD